MHTTQAAEFSGRVTERQAAEVSDLARAGYAVASSKVTALGDYWDLSGTTHLLLRVKGDGRAYIANVRTDTIAGTGGDVWQAPFRTRCVVRVVVLVGGRCIACAARGLCMHQPPAGSSSSLRARAALGCAAHAAIRAGVWADIRIPIDSLVLTFQGQLVERRLEFQADKVISVGVAVSAALADGAAGAVAAAAVGERGGGGASSSSSSGGGSAQQGASSSGAAAAAGSNGGDASAAAQEGDAEGEDEDVPEHERFRILIREIRTHSNM